MAKVMPGRSSGAIRKSGPPVSGSHPAKYEPSPEHKTHPGPWGPPKWHRRHPDISPCPVDVTIEQAQGWLDLALESNFCWVRDDLSTPATQSYWRDRLQLQGLSG